MLVRLAPQLARVSAHIIQVAICAIPIDIRYRSSQLSYTLVSPPFHTRQSSMPSFLVLVAKRSTPRYYRALESMGSLYQRMDITYNGGPAKAACITNVHVEDLGAFVQSTFKQGSWVSPFMLFVQLDYLGGLADRAPARDQVWLQCLGEFSFEPDIPTSLMFDIMTAM